MTTTEMIRALRNEAVLTDSIHRKAMLREIADRLEHLDAIAAKTKREAILDGGVYGVSQDKGDGVADCVLPAEWSRYGCECNACRRARGDSKAGVETRDTVH